MLWSKPFKNYLQFGDDFSFLTQTVSSLAVQLYCVDMVISTFSMLVSILAIYNTDNVFLMKFLA